MKILKFYADGRYAVENIPNTLEAMQKAVHGFIEIVTVSDDIKLIVNEEGKLNNSHFNRNATTLFRLCGGIKDHIMGDAFVTRVDSSGEEFTDLNNSAIKVILTSIGAKL